MSYRLYDYLSSGNGYKVRLVLRQLGLPYELIELDIKPECEIFDLAMLYNAADLVKRALLKTPPHVQFVMGIRGAMPARRSVLEFLLSEMQAVLPGATWTAAGIARHQLEVAKWALELGGHCRTGMEDNVWLDRDTLAPSNAALIREVVRHCDQYKRPGATPKRARRLLGLEMAIA